MATRCCEHRHIHLLPHPTVIQAEGGLEGVRPCDRFLRPPVRGDVRHPAVHSPSLEHHPASAQWYTDSPCRPVPRGEPGRLGADGVPDRPHGNRDRSCEPRMGHPL